MSTRSTYFFFVLSPINNIKTLEGSIRGFIQEAMSGEGFKLVQYGFKEDSNDQFPRYHPVDIDHFIKTELINTSYDGTHKLSMNFVLDNDDDMDLKVAIDTSERMSFIRAGYIFFKQDRWCMDLLKLCISFHQNFLPIYGYGITSPTDFPRVIENDEKVPTKLYTYNFFGQDLSDYFTKSKLSKLPAWKVDDLKDNGFFLAVEDNPFIEKEDIDETYQRISTVLGLEGFQRSD
jgi:hypothetical protein